jgi:hypothetical protein
MKKSTPAATPVRIPRGDRWIADVARADQAYKTSAASCTQSIVAAFLDALGWHKPMVLRAAAAFTAGLKMPRPCDRSPIMGAAASDS